jgi:spore coat polysaccharide biosynthesis protein SpsF
MSENPHQRPRIVAIIQARTGSTRFPGKVLHTVAGKPLLWHIVHRLEKSRLIEKIVIATSENSGDDAIAAFGTEIGVAVVRGSENNVLARFVKAAGQMDAGIVVRVCSDSPFIEGGYIDRFISAMTAQECDYVLTDEAKPNIHQGVDVFTRRALDKLAAEASGDPVAREHVSGYFKLHPGFVPIAMAEPYPDSGRAAFRVSIDTPDDLKFVETVYSRLGVPAGEASLGDVIRLVEREPGLNRINAHVRQKAIAQSAARALIRCDGGGGYGFGHVKRMIALAQALRDRESIGVTFALNGSEDALAAITHAGFAAKLLPAPDASLDGIVPSPDIGVFDYRDGPSRERLAAFTAIMPVSATIDDVSDRRLAADFAFLPPVPQALNLVWPDSHVQPRIGWKWALLGLPAPETAPKRNNPRPVLLVAMGGSDPLNLTWRAAAAMADFDGSFRVRFVIGQGMKDSNSVVRRIVALRDGFETVEGADNLATEYTSADLALASFGVTAYELAAFGVPAVYLSISADHALSASAFETAGMGVSLGLAENLDGVDIAEAVKSLLADKENLRRMRAAGPTHIDGGGAKRIARELAETLIKRRSA